MIEPDVLLDRYELLYPENKKISDLRRALVDKDLSSIFRLIEDPIAEDLRKAMMEDNLHSVFRLLGDDYEDLRKAVVEQNQHAMFRLVDSVDTAELRKASLERNLYSLFRILEDHTMKVSAGLSNDAIPYTGENPAEEVERIVNLRKAICNKNLYGLFRMAEGTDDLRKAIMLKDPWSVYRLLDQYCDTQFTFAFKTLMRLNLPYDSDCFSRGQLESKLWMLRTLRQLDITDLGTVFLCAGWYATLATMLFESDINVDKIRSFDLDYKCAKIAEQFNKPWVMEGWQFKASTCDITEMKYSRKNKFYYETLRNRDQKQIIMDDEPNTIINTSCEHLLDLDHWIKKIPRKRLVILQSNNYFEVDEHINCVRSVEEFSNLVKLKKVIWGGELELPKYTRYMLIGYS